MPRQKILQNYLFIIAILAMSNSFASTRFVRFNFDVGVLTQSHIDKLQLIADNHWNSYAGRYAQEILNEYYAGSYDVEPMVSWGSGGPKRTSVKSDIISSLLQVYPNPASEYFIVQLSMPNFVGSHQLQVVNGTGKLIHQTSISDARQQLAIDIQQWASGTYHIVIMKEGRVIETTEINIVR